MALVTTTGTFIRQYNAFTGLSAEQRSQSGIARAEVVYYNVNDTWPARGSGNNGLYQTGQIDLPKDFGYVLTDARIIVQGDTTADLALEAVGQYQLYPGGILGPCINGTLESLPSRQNDARTTAIGSITASAYNTIYPSSRGLYGVMVYELVNKPSAIIYPFNAAAYTSASNPASVFNFSVSENYLNGQAYEVTSYIRFLQYDIDQSYNYVIQSPQLTR
tara:strand:- start:249 stop:905 length:657 start_codon:yes stop_codon:yes gene_type:complete